VLVPVKSFRQAKRRLTKVFTSEERSRLARRMAERVVAAARGLPVAVVCDDEEVAVWAAGVGAEVVWAPGRGLNGAVAHGVRRLHGDGATHVVVSHADLPFARDLRPVGEFDGATLVPDRHGDGTNVICVPTTAGFRFAYGRGSFQRHRAEARRLGLDVRVIDDDVRLAWDVDRPDDLDFPADLAGEARDLLPGRSR
jgi:2-phospho-L-lactate/phosphoenolpyruvate guanylyltransferase